MSTFNNSHSNCTVDAIESSIACFGPYQGTGPQIALLMCVQTPELVWTCSSRETPYPVID